MSELDSGTIRKGDVITFGSRPRWWRRALYWLGILKPPKPRMFTVTHVGRSWTIRDKACDCCRAQLGVGFFAGQTRA